MSKELTPLKALEIIKNAGTIYVGCASNIYTRYSFECKKIETALKALEIIKEKIDVLEIIRQGDTQFGLDVSKEEYDLLKEVLL